MITSEDKIIQFFIEQDVPEHDHCLDYEEDDYTFYKGKYYQASADILSTDEKLPGVAVEWVDKGDCPPREDLTGAGIVIVIYQLKKIIAQYSRITVTDYDPITVDDLKGICEVNLTSDNTIKLMEKIVFADIKIAKSATGFPDDKFNTIIQGIEIDLNKDSILKHIDVLIP